MRRPLLGLAALFTVGCLLSDRRESAREAIVLLTLAASALACAPWARTRRSAMAALGAGALALGAASASVEALRFESGGLRRALREGALDGRPVRAFGRVTGDAVLRDGRLELQLELHRIESGGATTSADGRVRVEVGGEAEKPRLLDGDAVAAWMTLRPALESRSGLAAFGYCKSAQLLERQPEEGGAALRRFAARGREAARQAFRRAMPAGTERGLVLAMVLGDRSEIDEATAEAFRASGTYHVLALSGAQVALLAALLAGGLRRLQAGPWTEAGVTTLAVAAYALFVGGDVPIARAAVMAGAVLLGRALEVDVNTGNLLGLAALVLLAASPAAAGDVGFQLSFGATLGILALTAPLTRGLPRLPLRLDLAVAASVAAQCALAPLLAGHFHRLAPAAVLLNIAAVPLSGAVLLAGLGVLAATPLGLGGLSGGLAWLAARALRVSGDLGPAAPWLDLRVPGPSFGALALWVAGLSLLLHGKRARGLALLAAMHLAVALGPWARVADGRLHLSVIDVGQGDGALLRSPSGRAIVVDAGGSRDPRFDPGERRMAPELWRQGVRRLDGIVLSHAHPDHVGGVPFLLHAFRVAAVYEGPAALADSSWRRLDAALEGGGAGLRGPRKAPRLGWGTPRGSGPGAADASAAAGAQRGLGGARRGLRRGPPALVRRRERRRRGCASPAAVDGREGGASRQPHEQPAAARGGRSGPARDRLVRSAKPLRPSERRRSRALAIGGGAGAPHRPGRDDLRRDGWPPRLGPRIRGGGGTAHPLTGEALVVRSPGCGPAQDRPRQGPRPLMSQSEKSFTVSDRRHFTPEGRPRDDGSELEGEEQAAETNARAAAPGPGQESEGPADFSHFLLGLAAQAGQLIAGQELPEATTPEQALSGARSIIAILEMLKDKTEGRRTAEEDALVAELLFELRMAYVERTRAGKS